MSRLQAAADALAPFVRREQDFGTGYRWLYTAGFSFGGKPCWLDLCFRDGRLNMASWSIELPEGGDLAAEVACMRAELERQLGRSFAKDESFAWCSYDPRSDTASSGVRYG